MYYICTFTHRYVHLCVNEYTHTHCCSQHCAGRGIASPLRTNSCTSRICCALLIPNTKVLWVCPDLTLALQQRTALADPTECPLSCPGTSVSLARQGQQPPRSDPPCHFSTRFVLQLRHRRSIRVVLNLCHPKSFLAKPKEMPLKPLCASVSPKIGQINLILKEVLRVCFWVLWLFGEGVHGDSEKHACGCFFYVYLIFIEHTNASYLAHVVRINNCALLAVFPFMAYCPDIAVKPQWIWF